jgi:hypothetical protein
LSPLEKIYYVRVGLGVLAGSVCTGFGLATGSITNGSSPFDYTSLLNGITLMLVVYLLSYYVIKARFTGKVAKPTKLMTTGIGVYILAWMVCWVLLYTIIAGPPPLPLLVLRT